MGRRSVSSVQARLGSRGPAASIPVRTTDPTRPLLVTRHPDRLLLAAILSVAAGAGCAPRETRLFIEDHRADGPVERYYELFDECYYRRDAHGNIDIVASRHTDPPPLPPDEEGQGAAAAPPTVQVVHLRRVFEPIAGRTAIEGSMINATVSYLILGPEGGASFEGGGFLMFTEDQGRTEIAGKLESSALTPQRRLGAGTELFSRASVTGTFRATRDERQVVRLLNEMRRLFGPLPAYEPPPVNPDLR